MKKFCLILFICLFQIKASAQANASDSLKVLLKNAKHDTTKCNILCQLIANEYDDAVWPIYNEELLQISKSNSEKTLGDLKNEFLSYYAYAINNIGFLYMQNGKITEAYEQYYKSLELYKESNNKSGIATVLCNLGYVHRLSGNVKKAIESYHSALKLQTEINDQAGIANSYNNIGFIFDNQGEYVKALEYYNKSLDIYTRLRSKDDIAFGYSNISYIYKTYGDPNCKLSKKECIDLGYKKAVEFLNKAIKLHEETNNKAGLASALNVLAGIYDFYGDPNCLSSTNNCAQLSKDKAYEYYKKSLALRLEINNLSGITQSYNSLAEYMLKNNKMNDALEYGLSSMKTAKDLGSPERIRDAAKTLKKIYENQQRYKDALEMYHLYITMRDSTTNAETKNIAIKKSFQIEYEKKATADSVKVAEEKKVVSVQLKQEKTQRFALYGGLALVLVFSVFMVNRFMVTSKQKRIIEIKEKETQQKNVIISQQKHLVEEKQKEILDSINYAKRIQYTLLAHADFLKENIPNHFVYFNPKDIVSGDFYWATSVSRKQSTVSSGGQLPSADRQLFYLAACDSTGHGVPGAFMSLLNIGFLSEAINEKNILEPNEILNYARERLTNSISKEGQKDGFDGILMQFEIENKHIKSIKYAAANSSPILISENNILELPKDRMPVGKGEKSESFSLYNIAFKPGDTIYLYTDGFADQFGGEKGKKFKYKQLNELLLSINQKDVHEQSSVLQTTFQQWKGDLEQVDDVLVIGIKLS